MKCPYCLSEVDDNASVCKVCTKDLYLLAPLVKKIESLETQLRDVSDRQVLEERITELEVLIAHSVEKSSSERGHFALVLDILIFFVVPLLLLIGAHAVITVVYDAKLLYLRVVSILLPFAFAYVLFSSHKRSLVPWFLAALSLAVLSVLGMSWVTSLVDHTPVMPQSTIEWKDLIEYSTSISFSFLTGMLVGGIVYFKRHRRKAASNPFIKLLIKSLTDGKLSPQTIHEIMEKLNNYGSTVVAAGTTALSIYTGLKAVLS